MVSLARSESPLNLAFGPDDEKVLFAGLRLTAGFLLSVLFVISLVLSVHAFEAGHQAAPDLAKTWVVNGSFLTSDL